MKVLQIAALTILVVVISSSAATAQPTTRDIVIEGAVGYGASHVGSFIGVLASMPLIMDYQSPKHCLGSSHLETDPENPALTTSDACQQRMALKTFTTVMLTSSIASYGSMLAGVVLSARVLQHEGNLAAAGIAAVSGVVVETLSAHQILLNYQHGDIASTEKLQRFFNIANFLTPILILSLIIVGYHFL